MTTFLIPFLTFVAVILIMTLLYWAWGRFLDPASKAKQKRFTNIKNAVQGSAQGLKSFQKNIRQDTDLEVWLRSRSSIFEQFANLIKRARSPLTMGHFMGMMLALFVVVLMFGLLNKTAILVLLPMAAAIASTPVLWLHQQAKKRRRAFEDKLPDALDYISRGLRAGQSLTATLTMVGKEFPDPIGTEFKIVGDAMAFGISFKESIGELADRVDSNDLTFFVTALLIQHDAGGNLTELFDGLAKTIRERIKLRGKVRTLSAEGRASAWVLGSLPFALSGILMLINPKYISTLWVTPEGKTLITIGAFLMITGFFVINRMIQIKV